MPTLLGCHICVCFLLQVEHRGSPYQGDEGELLVRINFLSLQTIPVGMRSLPRFDYQVKHLLRARSGVTLLEHTASLLSKHIRICTEHSALAQSHSV